MLRTVRSHLLRRPYLLPLQIASWCSGIVFPTLLILIAISVPGSICDLPWQSGEWTQYAGLLLGGFPFLLGVCPAFAAIASLNLLLHDHCHAS
jgi:hypothetical protein